MCVRVLTCVCGLQSMKQVGMPSLSFLQPVGQIYTSVLLHTPWTCKLSLASEPQPPPTAIVPITQSIWLAHYPCNIIMASHSVL